MVSDSFGDTQTQILDAAEQLFAEQGFGATSLRSIIRAADVNLAAIHYHFGSKEKLIVATIERMAQPIVQAELQQLAAVQAEHPQPTVEAILHAMLAPALERSEEHTSELQSQSTISYAVFCLKKKKKKLNKNKKNKTKNVFSSITIWPSHHH